MHNATSLCRLDFVEIAYIYCTSLQRRQEFSSLASSLFARVAELTLGGNACNKKVSVSEVRRHGSSNIRVCKTENRRPIPRAKCAKKSLLKPPNFDFRVSEPLN